MMVDQVPNVDRIAMTTQPRALRRSTIPPGGLRLLASATLTLLATLGCNPRLSGECTVDTDCHEHSVCLESICVHPDLRPGETSLVSIVSPKAHAVTGTGELEVVVDVSDVLDVKELVVTLQKDETALLEASAARKDGKWTATLSLQDDTIASGTYQLVAFASTGKAVHHSEATVVIVDRDPPSLARITPVHANRPKEHPAGDAFVLGEEVVLDIELEDDAAGVTDSPKLTVPGVGEVEGSRQDDGAWRFRFDSRAVAGMDTALRLEVDVSLAVSDAVGNATTLSHPNAFRIDRRSWRWENPSPRIITAAPALVGDLVVFGDRQGTVFALDRKTGKTRWTHSLDSGVVGHVASDGQELFVITESGEVVWLDASADGSIAPERRETFRCPGDEPVVPAPPAGGVAVAGFGSGSSEETLLVYVTSGGGIRFIRKSGFDRTAPEFGTICAREYPLEDTAQDGTVPALRIEGEALLVHVGLASGSVVQLRVEDDGKRGLSITREWDSPVELNLKTPVSLADNNGSPQVLAAGTPWPGEGRVVSLDPFGATAWRTRDGGPFGEANVEATAVSANGSGWVVNRSGYLQGFRLSTGEFTTGVELPPRDSAMPRSTPVLGDNGFFYVPSGPRLSVVDEETATVQWFLDTRPNNTGTATEFVDGVTPALDCDGRLFVVVNGPTRSRMEALVTDSTGLARNGWPKGGRDNRNSSFLVSGDSPICVD